MSVLSFIAYMSLIFAVASVLLSLYFWIKNDRRFSILMMFAFFCNGSVWWSIIHA